MLPILFVFLDSSELPVLLFPPFRPDGLLVLSGELPPASLPLAADDPPVAEDVALAASSSLPPTLVVLRVPSPDLLFHVLLLLPTIALPLALPLALLPLLSLAHGDEPGVFPPPRPLLLLLDLSFPLGLSPHTILLPVTRTFTRPSASYHRLHYSRRFNSPTSRYQLLTP